MNQIKYPIVLLLAAIMLPFSWASAAVSLQFNNSNSNQVGGSPATLSGAPGSTITISLQLVSTAEGTTALDYWLSQFSGPMAGAFSITGRSYTLSDFPDASATDPQVTSSTDTRSNSASSSGGDGIADNVLNPRNGFDLGSVKNNSGVNFGAGTFQVANFTLTILPNAAAGLYQIRTFDYTGFGWSNTTVQDQPFSAQAAININVVPEPSTWAFMVLGGISVLAATRFRSKRA